MKIRDIALRRIIDSRGNPTVEAEIKTKNGFGRAAAPAGASTGTHEAVAWPDGSVSKGMKIAEEKIMPQLVGLPTEDQENFDNHKEVLKRDIEVSGEIKATHLVTHFGQTTNNVYENKKLYAIIGLNTFNWN